MSTINNIFGIAQSAIAAHQLSVQVASQNISNAQTEGYTRQRVTLAPGPGIRTPLGIAPTGVRVSGIDRVRDPFLDQTFRRDAGRAASYGMRRDLLQEIENVFGEPTETGLGGSLDAFWSAWGDLANDPMSTPARGMVRQRGAVLAARFHSTVEELDAVAAHAQTRLVTTVEQLNRFSTQVADLNEKIVASEAGGGTASDLRDARDRLIDQMATLGSTRVTERADGSVGITLENTLLVDGSAAKTLAVSGSGATTAVVVPASGATLSFGAEGSTIAEILRVLNTDIPDVRTRLDELAAAVVSEVNALHVQGNASAGIDFFDPAGTGASNIALSAAVSGNLANVATGYGTGASDNTLALDLAELADTGVTIGATTAPIGGFYRDLISGIALGVRSSDDSSTVYETLSSQTDSRRASVHGVSIDEELIHLMQHQQAYAAATRVVSAVDEMLRDLIAIGR